MFSQMLGWEEIILIKKFKKLFWVICNLLIRVGIADVSVEVG